MSIKIKRAYEKPEWWKTLFDEKYLKTYVDAITPELTSRQVNFILKSLKLKKGAEVLDLACGYGRHAIELAKRGYAVTGVDFSQHFIRLAKREAEAQNVEVSFIQGDMLSLSFKSKFDAVISMFTSFGYFDSEEDNALVFKKVFHALKPGGKFLIDLINAVNAMIRMAVEGRKDSKTGLLICQRKDKLSNGLTVTTKNEYNPETMHWFMTRSWKENGKLHCYKTDVRMYMLPEVRHLMEENGLKIEKVWGDFKGAPFGIDASRMIVLASKKQF